MIGRLRFATPTKRKKKLGFRPFGLIGRGTHPPTPLLSEATLRAWSVRICCEKNWGRAPLDFYWLSTCLEGLNPVSCCQDILRRTIGGGGRHGTLLPGALDALNCFYTVLHRSQTADSHLYTGTRHRRAASHPADDRTIRVQVALGYLARNQAVLILYTAVGLVTNARMPEHRVSRHARFLKARYVSHSTAR